MQLHHFFHEIQPKPGAFSPGIRSWQRVETLVQARQCIVRNRFALVEELEFDLLAHSLGGESHHALSRGEIQRIFQQVAQRLPQQKRLPPQHQVRRNHL
ncbi:hypothetical protein D3C72_2004800 [compost metagenome]